MRYIGFDMGDGESAVAAFEHGSLIEPVILPVCGSASLLSAVGLLSGEIVVGDRALTDALASSLGFGLVICLVSALREIASSGTLWDIPLDIDLRLPEAALPYAAFIMLGFLAAFLQWLKSLLARQAEKYRASRR